MIKNIGSIIGVEVRSKGDRRKELYRERTRLKLNEISETPNTEDEARVYEKLKKKARDKGITLVNEEDGTILPPTKERGEGFNSVISVMKDSKKGKPYVLAGNIVRALDKNKGEGKIKEVKDNMKGYLLLKKSKANKDTLKKARRGYYYQTANTFLAPNK